MSRFRGQEKLGVLAGILLFTSTVGVTARAAELDWNAPASCPTRDTLELHLRDSLGTPLAEAAALRFSAKVTQLSRGTFRLDLWVVGSETPLPNPPRVFEANSCEELVDTATVAIALALGARRTGEPWSFGSIETATRPIRTSNSRRKRRAITVGRHRDEPTQ